MHARAFAFTLPLLLAAGAAQAGFATRLQQGNWSGGVWMDDKTGEFRNCGLGLKFSGGTELTVVVPPNFNIAVIVADPRIAATPQSRFETATKFDQSIEQKTATLALSATMAQFAAPTFPNFYDAVRKSKKFAFALPGLSTSLDVTGLDQALPKLFECALAERAKLKLPPSRPEPLPEDRLEAGLLGLAAAEKAGVGAYIVFPDKERPPNFERPITLWGHPGVPGPDGPANIMGMTFWNPPVAGDGADKRREDRKALVRAACNDGSLQLVDLPGLAKRPGSFGVGLSCQGKYEEIYYVPRGNGGWFEIGLNSPPGKRRTLEAVGARYARRSTPCFHEHRAMSGASFAARLALSGRFARFGLALLAASVALLVWNESRSVTTHRALDIGAEQARVVDPARPDPANEDKLVVARGVASTAAPILDPETGVRLAALGAVRKVEIYQWREQGPSRRSVAGQTMDTAGLALTKVWGERPEPTTVYMKARGVENPTPPFGDRRLTAPGAMLGALALSDEAIAALPTTPHTLDPSDAPNGEIAGRPLVRLGEWLVASRTPQAPEIGDLRVSYRIAAVGEINLAARQTGGPARRSSSPRGALRRPKICSAAPIPARHS